LRVLYKGRLGSKGMIGEAKSNSPSILKNKSLPDSEDIKETDIVFDCPHCAKSLAIDYRGAGLTIPCSDCGKHVQVPIPEGMELTDIDSSDEEKEIRILNLRRSLAAAQFRMEQLEAEIEELTSRRDTLEKGRSGNMFRLGQIVENVDIMENSLKDMAKALKKITDVAKEEKDK
jgi:transcription elongation factor Elf1